MLGTGKGTGERRLSHIAMKVGLFVFLATLTIAQGAAAKDILVPDHYSTIGEAIEAASFGDTVYVKPGTYNERIEMKEGVNLVSFAGSDGDDLVDGPGDRRVLRRAARTIIDGTGLQPAGYLVSFPKETTAPMKLDGFTIMNMPKYVSGINLFMVEIRGCSPVVVNNIVAKNRSWGGIISTGLGIGMGPPLETEAKPIIRYNVIYDNHGPGISNGPNSSALIADNEIFDNRFPDATDIDPEAPGIGVREYARPVIENNLCYRNGAGVGGINLDSHDDPLVIRNNILHDNLRGGIGLRALGGAETNIQVVIENNKIYGDLQSGMRLSRLDKVNVVNNTVFDNRRTGIFFVNVDEAIIEDNEIFGNLTAGIRLLSVPAATLRRNHIYGNVTAGIDFIGWEKR
jgi:parallel beta-helix repeat protein